MKRTTRHCYTQNMKALGCLVSEKKIFFYVFSIVSLWELMTPGAGSFWTPGPWLAGFIKRSTKHCHAQNMKDLGLVVSEKKIFYIFPKTPPGAGPVWTLGARLAEFMKRTTRHCYNQNMRGLGLVVSEKKIFICFSIVSLWELSVAMETRVLIRPGQKPNTTFPLLNDALDKIWSRLALLSYRYSSLKMWTDARTHGRTDGRRLDFYTISSPCMPSATVS